MFSQVVTEGIVDIKDLALSVTLGLDGEFHQIIVVRNSSRKIEAGGHASIHTSSRDGGPIGHSHLGLHTTDFIEAIESKEWSELRLVIDSEIEVGS